MLASQDGVALADRNVSVGLANGRRPTASASEVDAATQYVDAAGLNVDYTYQGAGTVRVFGPPSSFALAFGVKPLAGYGNDTLNLSWTYNGSLYLPASLQGIVTAMIPVSPDRNGSLDQYPSAIATGSPTVTETLPTASSGSSTVLDLEDSQV